AAGYMSRYRVAGVVPAGGRGRCHRLRPERLRASTLLLIRPAAPAGAESTLARVLSGVIRMQTRTLGPKGPKVSALGLGCMGMSEFYGAHDDAESLATLNRALELGVTFLDTADAYGPYTHEVLVGRALHGRRERVFLATKFGFLRDRGK